jgi:hypothetical protein
LKPFAVEAARYDFPEEEDDHRLWDVLLTVGDLRRARAALQLKDAKDDPSNDIESEDDSDDIPDTGEDKDWMRS